MREYGQVQCAFWTDPDIQGLSDSARVLACYLLTGPHSNGLGCYRLPDGYIQADFGWSSERVSKGFQELFDIGFCERCETTNFVLIPKFLRWNPIANANVATAREKEFQTIPRKSEIHQSLATSLLEHGKHLSEPFRNHLETVSKQDPTLPNPEPDPTKRGEDTRAGKPTPLPLPKNSVERPDDIDEQVWSDFLAHRRQKKAKLTPSAWKPIRNELDAGIRKGHDPNEMLAEAMAAGWQGFKFDWYLNRLEGGNRRGGGDAAEAAIAYRRSQGQ